MIERTFVLIKPDGVARSLVGQILTRFEQAGLKIAALKMVWVTENFAGKHYDAHREKKFFAPTIKYVTEGPVVAMVIEGVHAVHNVRKLVGSTSPHEALPGTIRGDFAHTSMAYADLRSAGGRNMIHASDKVETAKQEISLWFTPEEIHSYKNVHEAHTFN